MQLSQPNFGILAPLHQPDDHVVAQIPQQASGVNQLAGGIMQGAEAGSNIATQGVARAATQQKMQQEAQLFPGDLHSQQTINTQNDMILQQEKQAQANQQQINQANNDGGIEGARKKAYQLGIDVGNKFDLDLAKTQQAVANVAKTNADTNTATLKNASTITTQIGTIASAAAKIPNPDTRMKVVQFNLSQQPEAVQKAWAAAMPTGWDDSVAMGMIATEHQQILDGAAKKTAEEAGKSDAKPTPILANQAARDQLLQQQKTDQTAGKPADPMLQQKIDELTKGIDGKPAVNGMQTEINKTDAGELKTNDAAAPALKTLSTNSHDILGILNKVPKGFVGKISDFAKLNVNNTDIQVLQHFFAENGFLAKTALAGQTSGLRLTQSELSQLNKIIGGTDVNWDSIRQIVTNVKSQSDSKLHDTWMSSNRIRSQGDSDDYKTWQKTNPEPYNPDTADKPSGYLHNGQPVPNRALQAAKEDHPGMSEAELVAKFGLGKAQ